MKTLALSQDWDLRNILARATVARKELAVAQYEGARRWSTKRSYLPGLVQDARFDADSATRDELVRKSRYFERNNAIVNRLADLFEQFTVGPNGLQIIPGSEDDDWLEAAAKWWAEWSEVCDLASRQSWAALQSQCARAWFIDGECFILLTESGQVPYRPRIQLIESHRVATPGSMNGSDRRIVDGVELNSDGRPIAYWVRDAFDQEKYRRIKADYIVHIFEPSRPGMVRGLPFLYPVMNDLHDLDDLQLLENQAAKDAARRTSVVKTQSGETFVEDDVTAATLTKPDGEDVQKYYESVFGPGIKALRTGDEYDEFVSQRPSVAVREYWDYLTSKICAGVGISKLLVYPWSMQGTVTRADLDVQNAFFRSRSGILGSAFARVYLYVMGGAIKQDLAVSDAPADWKSLTVRPPRSVNVDVGRNSAAMLAELEAGVRTFESVLAEMGEDWRWVFNQAGKEAAYIEKMAKKWGVRPEQISKRAMLAVTAMAEEAKSEAATMSAEKAATAPAANAPQPAEK